ncbi:uncharacterized protein LOC141899120 isoform X2 [Tubulanus polymorphus]|uniref:uncharacterized protein LOC141899120 isoform X2 n=1 Tax=Tubulanus polymorphus TaxID=672921 RepID=UPI003DA48449
MMNTSDVHTASSVGNDDEWELSKENVQPLKQGRQIANLSAALCMMNSGSSDIRLQEEKQQFENEIRTYSGDDPLEVWHRYINWTEQNFPRGGRDGKLLRLLEAVVHKFKVVEKYKNDKRYVDAWLKLSSMHNDPLAMYEVMWDLGYGTTIAAFYQTWSWTVEQLGNFKKADTIYQYGIERRAEPLDWLTRQHSEYQARIVKRTAGEYVDPCEGVPMIMQHEQQRIHLGQLRGSGKNKTVGSNRVQATSHGSRSGLGVAPLQLPQPQMSNARSNGVQIFCDENTVSRAIPAQTGEWQSIPNRSTFDTENEKKAGVWTKAKVKQKHMNNVNFADVSQVSRPDFDVHEDANQPPPATPKHSQLHFNAHSVLSDRKPSKSYDIVHKLQNPHPTEPTDILVMCRKDQIYQGVEEFQFEEIRAARFMAKRKEEEQNHLIQELAAKNQQLQAEREAERRGFQAEREEMKRRLLEKEMFVQAMQQMTLDKDNSSKPQISDNSASNDSGNAGNIMSSSGCSKSSITAHESASSLLKSPNWSASSGKTPDSNKGILKKSLIMPSPTVNTKEAMQAVFGMFNNTLDVEAHFGFGPTTNNNAEEPMETNFLPLGARPKTTYYNGNHSSDAAGIMLYEDSETVKPCSNVMVFEDPVEKSKPKQNDIMIYEDLHLGYKSTPNDRVKIYEDYSAPVISEDSKPIKMPNHKLMVYEDPSPSKVDDNEKAPVEDQENRAPVGYQVETKRQGLSGILQPSKGIAFEAPEAIEKMLHGFNADIDELDGICPLPDDQDFTFAPSGASTSKFNVPVHMISTPFHASKNVPLPDAGVSKIHRQPLGEVDNTLMEHQQYNSDDDADKENSRDQFRIPENVPFAPRTGVRTRCSIGLALLSPISETSEKSSSSNEASSNRLGLTTTHHHSTMHTHMKTPHQSINHSKHTSINPIKALTFNNKSLSAHKLGVSLISTHTEPLKLAEMQPLSETLNMTCHEVDISAYTPPDLDGHEQKVMSESIMINPKNPFDLNLIANFLANLDEPLNNYENYIECVGLLPQIRTKDGLILGDDTYMVDTKIGEGAFGKVYTAQTYEDLLGSDRICLKIQTPACPWEFYISCELQKRLSCANLSDLSQAFALFNHGYFYENGSCLVTPFHQNGSILF